MMIVAMRVNVGMFHVMAGGLKVVDELRGHRLDAMLRMVVLDMVGMIHMDNNAVCHYLFPFS